MNRKLKFVLTDVFAESKYSGNQLATFLDGSSLSDDEMQKITREIHFSETTFILPNESNKEGYRVRIFTPGSEVDFAGHPTLGTASVIRKYLIGKTESRVILNLNVGAVPVDWIQLEDGTAMPFMRQKPPAFGGSVQPGRMSKVLNLDPEDIDSQWPVEIVSTGLPFFIVPLKHKAALQRIAVQAGPYEQLIRESEAKSILAFCPEGYTKDQALGVRVFPIHYGIPEDPATGSGNGCLAAWLVKNRYFETETVDVSVGQGYEMGRPSLLRLKASQIQDAIQVNVGGKVQWVAEGVWA
jgi:trans-2,3-dihydro-3-hydroxyanthranilate isomerase